MTVNQLLETISNQYVDFFREALRKGEGVAETLLEMKPEGDNAGLYGLYRADYSLWMGDEFLVKEIRNENHVIFDAIDFKVGNLGVRLNPFLWHSCEMTIHGGIKDWVKIHGWIRKWLDTNDKRHRKGKKSLGNVIHSFATPSHGDGKTKFLIDFGSSNKSSIIQLIDILEEEGVSFLEISSSAMGK